MMPAKLYYCVDENMGWVDTIIPTTLDQLLSLLVQWITAFAVSRIQLVKLLSFVCFHELIPACHCALLLLGRKFAVTFLSFFPTSILCTHLVSCILQNCPYQTSLISSILSMISFPTFILPTLWELCKIFLWALLCFHRLRIFILQGIRQSSTFKLDNMSADHRLHIYVEKIMITAFREKILRETNTIQRNSVL